MLSTHARTAIPEPASAEARALHRLAEVARTLVKPDLSLAPEGPQRDYALIVDAASLAVEQGDDVILSGKLTNCCASPLAQNTGAHALRIVARLFSRKAPDDARALREFVCRDPALAQLKPRNYRAFAIHLAVGGLAAGEYRVAVDLVRECEYGFAADSARETAEVELSVLPKIASAISRRDWARANELIRDCELRMGGPGPHKRLRILARTGGVLFDSLEPRAIPACWDLFVAFRGHLFEERRFRTLSGLLTGLIGSSVWSELPRERRADGLLTLALSLLMSDVSRDEARAALRGQPEWTAREDRLFDLLALMVRGQFDGVRKILIDSEAELPAAWQWFLKLICELKQNNHATALAALRARSGMLTRELTARLEYLLLNRLEAYSAEKAAFARVDIHRPGANAFEIFALLLEPSLTGRDILRAMLKRALQVGDERTADELRSAFAAADYLMEPDEYALSVATAKFRWDEVAELIFPRAASHCDDVELWRKLCRAKFRSGRLQAALDVANEARLEPRLHAFRDEFNAYMRAAGAALAQRERPRGEQSRIVWDVTALINAGPSNCESGGGEKAAANVIHSALASITPIPSALIYWRELGHRPVYLSFEDFEQVAFHAARLALGADCLLGDRYYLPRPGECVVVLGSQWRYDSQGRANAYYKVHGAKLCVIIDDILPIDFPELHSEVCGILFERWISRVLASADLVLANSEFAKQSLTAFAAERMGATIEPKLIATLGDAGGDLAGVMERYAVDKEEREPPDEYRPVDWREKATETIEAIASLLTSRSDEERGDKAVTLLPRS
jgi:hypothetical protein